MSKDNLINVSTDLENKTVAPADAHDDLGVEGLEDNERLKLEGGEDEDDDEDEGNDDDDDDRIESLVAGRAKRTTAGNRLKAAINQEQDDDLELLFAEDEDDIEFEDEDHRASDVELDSSTDDEDQAPAKGEDELAGERDLQKQERLDKKKRKAHEMAKKPGLQRKKVKIDPTILSISPTAPRPKKKSERTSWMHTAADAPVRTSDRGATVRNREVTHRRLIKSAQQRNKSLQYMKEAQKRKEASKPKALTQEERMEEAAKTERKNAKSLNRWEESEKKRAADQKAKLEALHNRQLSGPVISKWSGLARWVNGKIGKLGVKTIREAGFKEEGIERFVDGREPSLDRAIAPAEIDSQAHSAQKPCRTNSLVNTQSTYVHPVQFAIPQGPYGFLEGIHAYAAMPTQQHQAESYGTGNGSAPPAGPANYYGRGYHMPLVVPPKGPDIEYSSRNLVALKNIDANALKMPEMQDSVLIKRARTKLQSRSLAGAATIETEVG